jgi:hypothetical protein
VASPPTSQEVDDALKAFSEGGHLDHIKLAPHIEHFLKTGKLPDAKLDDKGEVKWIPKKPDQAE